MSITSKDMLNLLYHKRLPQVYRDEDARLGEPLKRYLLSLIEGGYCGTISDIENTLLLIDPNKIPDKFFPYFCESMGLVYFPDIDIYYQRKFLSNVGELIRRRGTFSCIHYLVKTLTGLECRLEYFEGVHEEQDGNYLFVTLLAKNLEQLDRISTSMKIVEDYISYFIPYYILPVVSSTIDTQVVRSKSHSFSHISTFKYYSISKRKEVVS